MIRISFWQPAGEIDISGKGRFPEKFMPHSWDNQVGREVPLTDSPGGRETVRRTLVAVEVDEDGGGVTLTIEIPDDFSPDRAILAGSMSFAFREPEPLLRMGVPLDSVRPEIRRET